MSEVTGDIRVAIAYLVSEIKTAHEEGYTLNTYDLLHAWDTIRGTDWIVTTKKDRSPWDRPTHGYVVVDSLTGDRVGQTYTSKGGAANSFNAGFRSLKVGKFKDQTQYVLKRLVIADE